MTARVHRGSPADIILKENHLLPGCSGARDLVDALIAPSSYDSLALHAGLSITTLNALLDGQEAMSERTSVQVGNALKVPPLFLRRIQLTHYHWLHSPEEGQEEESV